MWPITVIDTPPYFWNEVNDQYISWKDRGLILIINLTEPKIAKKTSLWRCPWRGSRFCLIELGSSPLYLLVHQTESKRDSRLSTDLHLTLHPKCGCNIISCLKLLLPRFSCHSSYIIKLSAKRKVALNWILKVFVTVVRKELTELCFLIGLQVLLWKVFAPKFIKAIGIWVLGPRLLFIGKCFYYFFNLIVDCRSV